MIDIRDYYGGVGGKASRLNASGTEKLTEIKPIITKADIDREYITRHFVYRVTNPSELFEVNRALASSFKTNILFEILEVKWIIRGSKTIRKTEHMPSVYEANTLSVKFASETNPHLQYKLQNPFEYYSGPE